MSAKNLIYFLVLLVHILAGEFGLVWLSMGTKVLLMPMLIFMVVQNGPIKQNAWLVLALIFSWFGDLLLLGKGEVYFMAGLGCFLVAHLFYIILFSKKWHFKPLYLLPFVAFVGLMLLGPLAGKIEGNLQLPVYAYMLVISGMGVLAAMRNAQGQKYDFVLIGAVLFILSDSFIAINRFSSPIFGVHFWVMSTYGLAQWLIVKGIMCHKEPTA